jgi:hypothetical protein
MTGPLVTPFSGTLTTRGATAKVAPLVHFYSPVSPHLRAARKKRPVVAFHGFFPEWATARRRRGSNAAAEIA